MHEQRHMKHILTQEDISRMTFIENRYPIAKLPVCSHCERLAMWGKDGIGVCTHCGTTTLHPITLAEYYISGYDLDATSKESKLEKQARQLILPEKIKV